MKRGAIQRHGLHHRRRDDLEQPVDDVALRRLTHRAGEDGRGPLADEREQRYRDEELDEAKPEDRGGEVVHCAAPKRRNGMARRAGWHRRRVVYPNPAPAGREPGRCRAARQSRPIALPAAPGEHRHEGKQHDRDSDELGAAPGRHLQHPVHAQPVQEERVARPDHADDRHGRKHQRRAGEQNGDRTVGRDLERGKVIARAAEHRRDEGEDRGQREDRGDDGEERRRAGGEDLAGGTR